MRSENVSECRVTTLFPLFQLFGTQAANANQVAIVPRLRQQYDSQGVVATDIQNLTDVADGRFDVERATGVVCRRIRTVVIMRTRARTN